MSSQVETFLGWTGLGFGVLLAYGAYKDVPILGPAKNGRPAGLVYTALTTGKVPTVPGKGTVGPANTTPKTDHRTGTPAKVPSARGLLTGQAAYGQIGRVLGAIGSTINDDLTGVGQVLTGHIGSGLRHIFLPGK